MFCNKCGNEIFIGDKFCRKCGNEVISSNSSIKNNLKSNKNDKKIIGIVLGGIGIFWAFIIAIIVFVIFIVFSVFNRIISSDFVDLLGVNVPSVYSVVGRKTICSFNAGSSENGYSVVVDYCEDEMSKRDFDEYLSYLINENGYEETDSDYYRTILKDFKNGKYLEITVDIEEDVIYYDLFYDNDSINEGIM